MLLLPRFTLLSWSSSSLPAGCGHTRSPRTTRATGRRPFRLLVLAGLACLIRERRTRAGGRGEEASSCDNCREPLHAVVRGGGRPNDGHPLHLPTVGGYYREFNVARLRDTLIWPRVVRPRPFHGERRPYYASGIGVSRRWWVPHSESCGTCGECFFTILFARSAQRMQREVSRV